MRSATKRMWKAVLPPPQTPKNREDRLKAFAGVFQTVALSVFGVGILTPLLTSPASLTVRQAAARGLAALFLEVISVVFLLYIAYPTDSSKEAANGPV